VVGPGGVPISSNVNGLICPTTLKRLFVAKRQFPGLSNLRSDAMSACRRRTQDALAGHHHAERRAIVISLEGIRALCNLNACSDKFALFDAFEPKRIIGAVRMYSARPPAPRSPNIQTDDQRAPIVSLLVGGRL
jgi:hypothetical protein